MCPHILEHDHSGMLVLPCAGDNAEGLVSDMPGQRSTELPRVETPGNPCWSRRFLRKAERPVRGLASTAVLTAF